MNSRNFLSQNHTWVRLGLIRFFLACGLLTFIYSAVMIDTSTAYAQDRYHVVQVGESLSSIAASYGVTVSNLIRYNGITNPNIVRVGQTLRIPSATSRVAGGTPVAPSSPATSPAQTVTVPKPLPSVIDIAPTPTVQTSRGTRAYSVRAGDTLSSVAVRFGVSVSALKTRNGLANDTIYVGQRLFIP